jgi:transposase InsO family protein
MPAPAASPWYSAAELAALGLPGVPRTARKVVEIAAAERWSCRTDDDGMPLARKRKGQGGGLEYNVALLPTAARLALAKSMPAPLVPEVANDEAPSFASIWSWFERQSDKTKADAERRLRILLDVEALEAAGLTRSIAVKQVAPRWSVSIASIWSWFSLVSAVAEADRLPHLAPRRTGGGVASAIDADLWQALLSDYLRLSRPTWESSCRRIAAIAAARGLELPHFRTLWRKFEREVPAQVATLRREGPDALRKMLPPQKRTVADLHALELVNIDGHTCDVRVQWPDGRIGRPVMIGIQDVFSRKFLAWRFSASEDTLTARLCFSDLFRRYGIPKGLLADNGRAFTSKWLTGGAPTRFRFKIRDEDPVGLLVALGIKVHWAKPYRGQSKPVERGFRDFCDAIAKHPAFEGAYTGNNALNKPVNYGERAVPFETFIRVFEQGIAEHNGRKKRRTEMAFGRDSFDDVFERSYAVSPIGKATDEHLRMALLAADQVRADRNTGAVKVLGNSYWCQDLTHCAGQLVTVRFDPEDATQPVHVYDGAGRFVATADMWESTGFLDAEAAKRRAKLEADHRKAAKQAERALSLLSADQLAAMLPDYADEGAVPEPKVVRAIRSRGPTAAALKPVSQAAQAPAQPAILDAFLNGVSRLRVVGD